MTVAPVLDADETASLIDFPSLVDALQIAAVERADGRIACPERLVAALADDATMLSMPAVAVDVAIHKLITVTPRNASRGLPTIQGRMTVLDPVTGATLLSLDGPTVTGRRTAALSSLAIELLTTRAPRDVLLIGTGAQASHHVDALAALWPDVRLHVRSRDESSAVAFCDARRGRLAHLAPVADEADRSFDVVITCTTSRTPVWTASAGARTLVVAVGSFRPDQAEIAAQTVCDSSVVVDDLGGARQEAGDLVMAGVDWDRIEALADLVRAPRRLDGPMLFKSVGCAAWDLAAARVALTALQAIGPSRASSLT